jgi:histidinol-phosphate aminotransferase
MTKKWFNKRLQELSKLQGYQKPEYHEGVLKLDSNENFAINKQLQQELIDSAKKNSDVR